GKIPNSYRRVDEKSASWLVEWTNWKSTLLRERNYEEQASWQEARMDSAASFVCGHFAGADHRGCFRYRERASAETSASARSFDQQDANRIQLRGEHLDCQPRRQQCSPFNRWRPRGQPYLFTGRLAGRVHRRLRWNARGVRGAGGWGCASPTNLSPG